MLLTWRSRTRLNHRLGQKSTLSTIPGFTLFAGISPRTLHIRFGQEFAGRVLVAQPNPITCRHASRYSPNIHLVESLITTTVKTPPIFESLTPLQENR